MSDYAPIWHRGLHRQGRCPVCGQEGDLPVLLEIRSLAPAHPRVAFSRCPGCGSIFQLAFQAPRYDRAEIDAAILKFYLEQGAGLETLVMPALLARERVRDGRYLEIGCGFGFGLDFARYAFGWDARGIDPSPLAREGGRQLGLDIRSEYLSNADVETCDAIAALEVLEHIAEPHRFLETVRGGLGERGILVLTTPTADYVEFDRDKPGLLAVLTPGYHAILYTPKSLDVAFRSAGFSESQITTRGATLFALAGRGTQAIDIDEAFDPALYRRYLEYRLATVEPESSLGIGLGYRLLKHLVNAAMFEAAEPLQKRLAEAVRHRDGIDILDPPRLAADLAPDWSFEQCMARLPACLVGLLYFSGMLRLNMHDDRSGAADYFSAARTTAGVLRKVMKGIGVDDPETADLEMQASRSFLCAIAYGAPDEAAAGALAFDLESADASLPEEARRVLPETFVHLSNLGALDAAARLADQAQAYLAAGHAPERLSVELHRALGLLEINRRNRPRQAALHFARSERIARRLASSEPEWAWRQIWQARHDRLMAWMVCADANRALLAGRTFEREGEPAIPGNVATSAGRLLAEARELIAAAAARPRSSWRTTAARLLRSR